MNVSKQFAILASVFGLATQITFAQTIHVRHTSCAEQSGSAGVPVACRV